MAPIANWRQHKKWHQLQIGASNVLYWRQHFVSDAGADLAKRNLCLRNDIFN
jgi:hypothetical protein